MPISCHALKRIIANSGYKYRKARTTLTSNSSQYIEKTHEIQNILSHLKENEKFSSIDEYDLFQLKCKVVDL